MEKVCIFCGEQIQNKSQEHVIPKWLIEMTGDKNRKINVGLNYNEFLKGNFEGDDLFRQFSFNSFTFPACNDCNSNYGSGLEDPAKDIVTKILNNKSISKKELIILLDWLDKIRIGLWLGYRMLNKDHMKIDPKFHISQRIRLYDRLLYVYKADISDIGEGINFLGVNSPVFAMLPSCFCLRINEYFFFNISKELLFLDKLGFPCPDGKVVTSEGLQKFKNINEGYEEIKTPIIDFHTLRTQVKVYQPIFTEIGHFYDFNNDYVKKNSYDFENGIGEIFIEEKDDIKKVNSPDKRIDLNPKRNYISGEVLLKSLVMHCLKTSINLLKDSNDCEYENVEIKNRMKRVSESTIKITESLIESINL
ncbi:MAG: hypothetical protein ACQEQI_02415 [Bacillota bacterium]